MREFQVVNMWVYVCYFLQNGYGTYGIIFFG
jgi:hypothetical protein